MDSHSAMASGGQIQVLRSGLELADPGTVVITSQDLERDTYTSQRSRELRDRAEQNENASCKAETGSS